jgi:hypothetical protein
METPKPDRLPEETIPELVDALNDLRNAMVKASLLLRDLQFDFDAAQRHAAAEQSSEWIDKIMER